MADHKHYKEYIDTKGDGRIILYTRSDQNKPRYYVRLKFPHQTGYVIRSSKTMDQFEARRFAEDLYYEIEGKLRRGEQIKDQPFSEVFEDWKNNRRIEGKDKVYTAGDIRAVELYILPFFKNVDIRKIDSDKIRKFFDHRINSKIPPPSTSTLKQEVRRLKNILTFCFDRGNIQKIPKFPVFRGGKNPRPDFNGSEWRQLYSFMRNHVKEVKKHKAHYRDRFYLQHYVLILANSGIRTGEARKLKWCDVGNTKTLSGETRMVLLVNGKTGSREVVCNETVGRYLMRLYEFRKNELHDKPSQDEYVFAHSNGDPIKSFKRSFETLLEKSGLMYNSKGQKRVIYSLRHTYATMRLQEGVSIFQLAANMGTSVEMIEGYYGKKRTTTAKAATEITKMGLRDRSKESKSDALPWE
jgi:integrase